MNRRSFVKIAGVGIVLPNLFACTNLPYYVRKIKGKLFQKDTRSSQRKLVDLPIGWEKVTVETTLNSRCTSDYDDNPSNNHWGMANGSGKLSEEQLLLVVNNAHYRRFSDGNLGVERTGNMFHFFIDPKSAGKERTCLNVEIGTILQTFGSVCAAMGIAVVIQSYGENGILIDGKWRVLSYQLEPMKPSNKAMFWTSDSPSGERCWRSGNLPDPNRSGSVPLMQALGSVAGKVYGSLEHIDLKSFSQLLWAARGRTPHLYLSKPWGMTIPAAYGVQSRSGIYVVSANEGIRKYVNWNNGPTHSLEKTAIDHKSLLSKLINRFPAKNTFVLLSANEATGYAVWETGFMLQNVLLQAAALDCMVEVAFDLNGIDSQIHTSTICAVVALATV